MVWYLTTTPSHYIIQLIPALQPHASLFIPEVPGYGISSSPPTPDKKAIATIILEALHQVFPNATSRPLVWCSHDRGARIGHRLLADPPAQAENIVAALFMDIVPTLEQWRSFSNPAAAVRYFHWPFLATPFAPEVIEAVGGDKFCRMVLAAGKGGNEAGVQRLQADGAYDVYAAQFAKAETIKGSCDDYADGSVNESQAQEREQSEGKKVRVPTLVLYSEGSLAKMHDVEACWKPWVDGELTCVGIGEGHGHYFPESAPEVVAEHVLNFLKKVVK